MSEERSPILSSAPAFARNTLWNLLGFGASIPVAVVAVPLLLSGLGTERFGLLAIAWMVLGYFGFFDLGLARATTKFFAEYSQRGELKILGQLTWSSIIVHVFLGLIGGGLLAALTPWLIDRVLRVPAHLLDEARTSFYVLAISVPLIVVTSALRGVLEALHRFDLVSAIKIPAGIMNYLGPLLVLFLTNNLAIVIGVIVAGRVIALIVHVALCWQLLPFLSKYSQFNLKVITPLIGFGGWLTVSNVINPIIVSADRFMIGTLVSMSAVAYYATPYEVVTKLWIFSASLLGVLFPVFSALSVDRGHEFRSLYGHALRYLFVLVSPLVCVLLALASDLLAIWVGPELAVHSVPVAKWLALGVLINVLAQVPFTALQSLGRADVTGKLLLIELPFYVLLAWYLTSALGITGTALAWVIRAAVDAVLLFIAADRMLPASDREREGPAVLQKMMVGTFFLLMFGATGLVLANMSLAKVAVTIILFGLFIAWEWQYLLSESDRHIVSGFARPLVSLRSGL